MTAADFRDARRRASAAWREWLSPFRGAAHPLLLSRLSDGVQLAGACECCAQHEVKSFYFIFRPRRFRSPPVSLLVSDRSSFIGYVCINIVTVDNG